MIIRQQELVNRVVNEIARLDDPSEILAHVASAILEAFGRGALVTTNLLPVTPLFAHVEPRRLPAARAAFAGESALAARAAQARKPICARILAPTDPLEGVRVAFGVDAVTVVPLASGARALGFVAAFGPPLGSPSLDALQNLALVAAATLDRVVAVHHAHAEVEVREGAINMLSSLVEKRPLPWLLVDARRRAVGWNASFAAMTRSSFGLALDQLDLPESVQRVVSVVFERRVAQVTESAGLLVAAHPVTMGHELSGVGVTLVDVSAAREAERNERVLRAYLERLLGCSSLVGGFEVSAAIGAEAFEGWAVTRSVGGVLAATTQDPNAHVFSSLLARRTALRFAPSTIPADELALLSLSEGELGPALQALPQTALLSIPLGIQGALLCVGRARDFSAREILLAAELARTASRALSVLAEQEEVRARALLFGDFVEVLSREVADRLATLTMTWFVLRRSPSEELRELVSRSIQRLNESVTALLSSAPRSRERARELVDLAEIAAPIGLELRAPSLVRIDRVPLVHADATRVRQALVGVLQWVLARAREDELLCLRVERVRAEVTVTLSLGQRGHDHDEARTLFDAFWYGDEQARALTVARAVFASHGGRSWVETAEDAGAAYVFALPVGEESGDLGEERRALEGLLEAGAGAER